MQKSFQHRPIPFIILTLLVIFSTIACQPNRAELEIAQFAETITAIPPAPSIEAEIETELDQATPAIVPSPTQTESPTATPEPTFTPTPAYPQYQGSSPIDPNLIGIQVHPFGEDQALMFQQLDELGVGWVKIQISWKLFEPAPGRLDEFWFGETDRFIDAAHAQGLNVMVGIAKAPEWSRPTTTEDGPPSDFAEFTRFTELVANRYSGKVQAYELWNEPNLRREWNGFDMNGASLVQLVAAGADGIRRVDPSVVLISGAPAPTGINDGVSAIDDRVYFEQMLAAGIALHVDGIGYHPYGASNPVWATMGNTAEYAVSHNDHPSFFFSHTTEDYQRLMMQYGVDLPLWGTEFGWGSYEMLGKPAPAGAEFMNQLSEWEQAIHIIGAFEYTQNNESVGPLILWNLNFGPLLGADFPETGYAILRPDGSKRPAYLAIQHLPK